jgi:hypothetical protein
VALETIVASGPLIALFELRPHGCMVPSCLPAAAALFDASRLPA